MKRYLAPLLIVCLAACSEPIVETTTVPDATAPGTTEPAAEPNTPDVAPEPVAAAKAAVFEKPQLVYYRINKH